MAFSAHKPCSRIMRASPHQSDQQEKEAYNLLLQEESEDADEEAHRRKSFNCKDPPLKQLILSSNSSSLSSDPPSPIEQLPTFIAPQGLHSLQLPLKKECAQNWFSKHDHHKSRHLVPQEAFAQSLLDDFHPNTRSRGCSMLRSKLKKPGLECECHPKQKLQSYKKSCGGTNNSIYDLALDRTVSMPDQGSEKKRRSSTSARDMINIRSKDAATWKSRFWDVQSSSWEEEVRQAMAKSSSSKRQDEKACKEGVVGCGMLQRPRSVKEHGISALPPTLIVKRSDGPGNTDAAVCAEEAGAKLYHDNVASGNTLPTRVATDEKRMWKGFNVVKSPSEERWEEAAQDEERQEMQRRVQSQSMRYDTNLTGVVRSDANVFNDDEEWAVYTRSGYVTVKPRRSNAEASATCCSSLMGRSLSMRDTRMGLVMECAACGTALHGAGGRLLCFCACCAAARAQGTPSSPKKKGGGGILRACRRLLGLNKKRACNP